MAISQIVDEQIKQIRKERAELDELRASLERRSQEISIREAAPVVPMDLSAEEDRKATLLKEISALTTETERLRAERDSSIESFGGELKKVHAEKTAESAAQVKQLQNELNYLIQGKTDLEAEVAQLKDELANLEQTKKIEWNKLQTEISRSRVEQEAELDERREKFLADLEKEKAVVKDGLRTVVRKERADISAEKREWEKEILECQKEKQKIQDETKFLEYEYEKAKSENILKLEKTRVDDEKQLAASRADALVELEKLRLEKMKEIDDMRLTQLHELETLRQERISELEKSFLQKSGQFEQIRAQRLEECYAEIRVAKDKLDKTMKEQREAERQLDFLRSEVDRIFGRKDKPEEPQANDPNDEPFTAPIPAPEPLIAPEPMVEPIPDPLDEPEPLIAPVAEPMVEPEPFIAPVAEPMVEPEPPIAPVAEPMIAPISEPESMQLPISEPLIAPEPQVIKQDDATSPNLDAVRASRRRKVAE